MRWGCGAAEGIGVPAPVRGRSARFLETPAAVVASDLRERQIAMQMIGRQLGPYTLIAPLGAGGMGEVYRARDSKLGRDVAIKILPSNFTVRS